MWEEKVTRRTKSAVFLSTCGGGGCCVPALRTVRKDGENLRCWLWCVEHKCVRAHDETRMPEAALRLQTGLCTTNGRWVWKSGSRTNSVAGLSMTGGPGHAGSIPPLKWMTDGFNCAYKNNQACIAITETRELSEITQSIVLISLRNSSVNHAGVRFSLCLKGSSDPSVDTSRCRKWMDGWIFSHTTCIYCLLLSDIE